MSDKIYYALVITFILVAGFCGYQFTSLLSLGPVSPLEFSQAEVRAIELSFKGLIIGLGAAFLILGIHAYTKKRRF